jgi:hypothetical protein
MIIAQAAGNAGGADGAILALIFAPGERPDIASLTELSRRDALATPFALSHIPADENWAELLAAGLSFDCRGLAPGQPEPFPGSGAMLGLHEVPEGESITLQPSQHLAEGRGMLPIVRVMAGLGTQLATLPGLLAVHWIPARCWMTSKYFCGVIETWLEGGAFPSLGLTSLQRENDGAIVSAGLDYLIGQELRFEPDRRLVPAAAARVAARLTNELVGSGPLQREIEFTGPDGESLKAEPFRQGRQIRLTLKR